MRPLVTLFLLLAQLASLIRADFYLYVERDGAARVYRFFDHIMTDCDKIQEVVKYRKSGDVSGDKKGVRSVGRDELDPDILEFNTDFGHYSKLRFLVFSKIMTRERAYDFAAIYKERNSTLVDLQDQVKGQCFLWNKYKYSCVPCWLCWDEGNSIFWCDTAVGTEGGKLQLEDGGNSSMAADILVNEK